MHKKPRLEELELLDLHKCQTVGDIVQGMSKCSFGARNIGEVAIKLEEIIFKDQERVIVYDGRMDSPLGRDVQELAATYGFQLVTPEEYVNQNKSQPKNLVVIGRFSEFQERKIYEGGRKNTIFINEERLVTPGQTRDGFFPNVAFTDPEYAIPLIKASLKEWINGKKTGITQFVEDLGRGRGLAKEVSLGAKNFSRIVNNPKYTIIFTMSGAMTIAQMSYLVCDMIDEGMIHMMSTTGAAMAHGVVESTGLKHFKHKPSITDTILAKYGWNRVTDTIEPETNFDHIDSIMSAVLSTMPTDRAIAPSDFHLAIGKYLSDNYPDSRGILKSAYEHDVPVFVPAFFDSEIGNDITTYNINQMTKNMPRVKFDLELENHKLIDIVQKAKKLGIFTVGGGPPRNWPQNQGPLIEIIINRTKWELDKKQLSSGIKIAPDPMDLGHLGGCTYEEGKSWRKMDPHGMFVEIHGDATYIWPIVLKYAQENRQYRKAT